MKHFQRWVMLAVAAVLALYAGAGAGRTVSAGETSTVFLPLVLKTGAQGHWVTIFQDDFEAGFPAPNWTLYEFGPGDYKWNTRTCAAHSPTHSVWAIGGGADGNGLGCGAAYPNNMDNWMVAGPFDLSDATAAELNYQVVLHSQIDVNTMTVYDGVCSEGSHDGNLFDGDFCYGGNTAGVWHAVTAHLNAMNSVGNLLGDDTVWVGLYFKSDGSVTFPDGAFADDFVLRKCVGGPCAPGTAVSASEGGLVRDAAPVAVRLGLGLGR